MDIINKGTFIEIENIYDITDSWKVSQAVNFITGNSSAGSNYPFNPMEDFLVNNNGQKIKLDEPNGIELPTKGFDCEDNGYQPPSKDGSNIHVIVKKDSKRLQLLTPFPSSPEVTI